MAKIAENVSGQSYQNLVSELFKKCKMERTIVPDASNQQDVIAGYAETTEGNFDKVKGLLDGVVIPAGGVASTAGDVLLWNENLHHGKLLSNSSYQSMTTISTRRNHSVMGDVGVGYGLLIDDKGKIREMGHTGYILEQGFTSINMYYPSSDTSLIILENQAFDYKDFDRAFFFEKEIRKFLKENL